jgi:hypothetical protein
MTLWKKIIKIAVDEWSYMRQNPTEHQVLALWLPSSSVISFFRRISAPGLAKGMEKGNDGYLR